MAAAAQIKNMQRTPLLSCSPFAPCLDWINGQYGFVTLADYYFSWAQDGSAFGTDRKLPTQPLELRVSSGGMRKWFPAKHTSEYDSEGNFHHSSPRELCGDKRDTPTLSTVTIFRLHFFESIITMMVIVFPQNLCQVLCKRTQSDEGNFSILYIFEWATSISWQDSCFKDQFGTVNQI